MSRDADGNYDTNEILDELERRIASRYDKTSVCYSGFLCIACALLWI